MQTQATRPFSTLATPNSRDLSPVVPSSSSSISSSMSMGLLLAALESFPEGLLIVEPGGNVLHSNQYAKDLLAQANGNDLAESTLTGGVQRLCQALESSRSAFPTQQFVLEDDVVLDHGSTVHLRGQWFARDAQAAYLLIRLEDCQQTQQAVVMREIRRFGLTEREAEVWQLRRTGHDYRQIAEQLYISINTVKKHLKSIYMKRQQMQQAED